MQDIVKIMKGEITEWEKIFGRHIYDKVLVSKIYIQWTYIDQLPVVMHCPALGLLNGSSMLSAFKIL